VSANLVAGGLANQMPKRRTRGPWWDAGARLLRHRWAVAGAVVVGVFTLGGLLAPVLSLADPALQDYNAVFAAPSPGHPLGADNLGRDTWSRLLHGARTSLAVGVFTQAIVLAVGVPVGAIAGFLGGRTGNLMMRVVDAFYAFPDLLLIILLRAIFGGSIFMVFLAIGLVEWTGMARLTRAQVLALKHQEYLQAAAALGASPAAIVARHVAPNGIAPIVVAAAFGVPRAIFAEAALGYLGVGVQPPTPSWGGMVLDGYQAIFVHPHLILAPTLAIAVLTLAFNFLGDGLRDALDPHQSR
jgi:oligopeptide transport system permease protein